MVIYTAGPYSPNAYNPTIAGNIQRAKSVAVELWEMGYTVICPHLNTAHFERYIDLPPEIYIERDLEIVKRCDGIVMLPDWEHSRGAVQELMTAREHRLKILFWPDVPRVEDLHAEKKRIPVKLDKALTWLGL